MLRMKMKADDAQVTKGVGLYKLTLRKALASDFMLRHDCSAIFAVI